MMRSRETGMVTAETAVVIPFLVILALVLAWVIGLGVTHVRVTDAAREAARAVARGDAPDVAQAAARQAAGDQAEVAIDSAHGYVTVTVSVRARPPMLPAIGARTVSAEAVAAVEQPEADP